MLMYITNKYRQTTHCTHDGDDERKKGKKREPVPWWLNKAVVQKANPV